MAHFFPTRAFVWQVGLLGLMVLLVGCGTSAETVPTATAELISAEVVASPTTELPFGGCTGEAYPDTAETPYVLPFAVGETHPMGLTNCTTSFHGEGTPDQYAYDFDMPLNHPFTAARAGPVIKVYEDDDVEDEGEGPGNHLIIDHHDGTFGMYFHSPHDGIFVEEGDEVEPGDELGLIGKSGLAGYPHLHFIVVRDSTDYPYQGVPVSFRNASPPDVALRMNTEYTAESY